MDRWGRTLLAVMTALAAVACTQEQIGQVLTLIRPAMVAVQGGVSGKVVDQSNQKPVPDAKLTVGTQKTTSDAQGAYSVRGLTAGTLFVRVDAAGYQPFFGEVQIAAGTTTFDIPLKPLTGASPGPSAAGSPEPTPTPVPVRESPGPQATVAPARPTPTPVPSGGSPAPLSDAVASVAPSLGPSPAASASPSPKTSPSASPSP